jgi:hypothetical protein
MKFYKFISRNISPILPNQNPETIIIKRMDKKFDSLVFVEAISLTQLSNEIR